MSTARAVAAPVIVARLAAALVALLLLAFAAWQYAMPAGLHGPWGLNSEGVVHFRQALRAPIPVLSEARFRAGQLGLLLALCLTYVVLCAAAVAAGPSLSRSTARWSLALAIVLAVLCPPSLSTDVYAYVGYARLAVIHHANPYLATQASLVRLGDPTGPFLRWPISSPYGPLWTLLSMVPVAALPGASLFLEVVVMKLFAAGGVMALAHAGSRLADKLAPGRGPVAFVALALNPLFLIEGPGNGHNDLVMMALVVGSLAALVEGCALWALAFAGLGGAVKFVPLLLAPWLLGHGLRQRFVAEGRRSSAAATFSLAAVVIVLGPLVVCYLPFWHGLETLSGLHHRWLSGHGAGAAGKIALVSSLAAYALLSAWVLASDGRRVVIGWIATSTVAVLFLVGICFPWYVSWPTAAALALQDRRGRVVAGVLFSLGAVLSLRYAFPLAAP